MSKVHARNDAPINSPRQVLFASLIGTTIEFFDFYIYATAAVLVFPKLFFPASDPASATLASLATFGIAFLARPIGSALFGHFGDRIGRKTTLVVALSPWDSPLSPSASCRRTARIGFAAPCCWRSAVLARVSAWAASGAARCCWPLRMRRRKARLVWHVSAARRARRFLSFRRRVSAAVPLADRPQFFTFGWRLPFLASGVLVFLGLYVRLTITETPVFRDAWSAGSP